MTEDELKAIEARAKGDTRFGAKAYEGLPTTWSQNDDVLALVAEVRRLRGFMKRGDLAEMNFFDKREAAERAARIVQRCPARESGGVQCELAAGHEGEHACPEAIARAAPLTCEHANTITKPEDETFLDRLGCLDCGVWLQPVRTKHS
jgi:hypothetical protein